MSIKSNLVECLAQAIYEEPKDTKLSNKENKSITILSLVKWSRCIYIAIVAAAIVFATVYYLTDWPQHGSHGQSSARWVTLPF